MASTDARPIPIKNAAYRVYFVIRDENGDLVSGASGLDSEISKDGGSFADCTSEATEIGSTGVYYLDLTNTEMNADNASIIVKTSTVGAKTTFISLYPQEADDILVNVTHISGDSGAADSLEALLDGTGATLTGNLSGSVGSVAGNVSGNVLGYVGGNVLGSVEGDVLGSLSGNVGGDVLGSIAGNLAGSVEGDVLGDVEGDVVGDVLGFSGGGDPWATDVVAGGYTANQAGNIVATYIDAKVSEVLQGNLAGDVLGNVAGNIGGNILGSVEGDVLGSVAGNLAGSVEGDVLGSLKGNVEGSIEGDLEGDLLGSAANDWLTDVMISNDALTAIGTAVWASGTRTLTSLGVGSITDTTFTSDAIEEIALGVWDLLTDDIATPDSIGKMLVDLNDAVVSTGVVVTSLSASERNAIADALLDRTDGIEAGVTPKQSLRAILATTSGITDVTGNTVVYFAPDDATARITGTMDANRQRTSVTRNL